MFTDNVFRIAFAVSLSLHLFAISTGGFLQTRPAEDKTQEIEVTYLIEEKIIRSLPESYSLEKKKLRQKPKESAAEQYLEEKELKKLEEYIQYYEFIREKIKQRVIKNYSGFAKEGRVDLTFTLNRYGALKSLSINEAKSVKKNRLREIALESVKSAAPFPAFPPTLDKEVFTFDIAIIFKKR